MWEQQESVQTTARREAIWAVWSDVDGWKQWNPGVTWAKLEGPFSGGTTGRLKPAGGLPSSFDIVDVERNQRWTLITRLPGATLRFEHRLADAGEGHVEITYHARLTGPLAPVFERLSGKALRRAVSAVHQLVAHVERS